MTKNKKRRKLSLGITMNINLIDSIVFMRYSPNETQNTFRKYIFTKYIYIKISKFDIFQFFLNFTFFQKWSAQKHSATKMSLNIASVYLQENWTKSTQGIHFKKPKISFFDNLRFSIFLKNIIYCINYNYKPIKQLICQKNV